MSRNEHTGDKLVSKANSDDYRDNYDAIFGVKEKRIAQIKLDNCSKVEQHPSKLGRSNSDKSTDSSIGGCLSDKKEFSI
jgi:hypothetical protein